MFERLTTHMARGFCLALALALVAGLAAAALPALQAGTRDLLGLGGAVLFIAAAAALGAALAWRGTSPARLLARIPTRIFLAGAFVLALGTGVWAHARIQKHAPDVPDELGYLHQARTFADGRLAAPTPPAPEFHYVSWGVHDRGMWYAVFPPGYGILLAGGVLVGAPWLVNPLLGAILVLVLFALARALAATGKDHEIDEVTPRLAVLLYLGSWFRLMHAGSYMAHPTAALFTAIAVLGIARALTGPAGQADQPGITGRGALIWAGAGGAALAFLCATRQLDAVIVALALVPLVAHAVVRRPRRVVRPLVIAALCALPLLGGYLAYNRALTGAALLPPQQRYMELKERRGDCFRLGFGPGVGECPLTQNTHFGEDGFQPRHAAANTARRLEAWTRWSFGWSPLALLPVIGLMGGALAGGAAARRRALLGGLVAATVLGYGLFFYHGVAYGARFYYSAFPFAVLLGAAGALDLGRWVARLVTRVTGRERVGVTVAGALGGALPAVIVCGVVADWPAVNKHAGQRLRSQNGAQLVALSRPELGDALVFVDSMIIPAAVTAHPASIPDNRPLVVKDLGERANAGFARLYPDRRPVRLAGTRVVPLAYAKDAPMRHEGGALYPLEQSSGGFGQRVAAGEVRNLPLSLGEALRFTVDGPGARFAVPVWALADDAGAMVMDLQLVHHPAGASLDVAVDGRVVATGIATRADTWSAVSHSIDVELTPGPHRVEIQIPGGARGQLVIIDYVELRRQDAAR